MSNLILTDQERAAFYQDITRGRALDYFYIFDNVPLQFIYRDRLIPGELTDLEKRNKAITETLWLDAYHQYLVCNVPFVFTYRGGVLQMPLQIHEMGAGMFSPPATEDRPFLATVEEVQARFDAWMASEGWKMVDDLRQKPPRASWQSLLGAPDRSVRIASLIAVGNQVILELISTWTEDGSLQETAWVVVLIYDVDGSVLQDRSYIDMANWPSGRRYAATRSQAPRAQTPTAGIMDAFFEYQKTRRIEVHLNNLEKRNLSIIEGAWVDAQHDGLDPSVFHADRFRLQLPLQKCSCNLHVARDIEALVKQAAPDRTVRLGLTYAKGNQVVAEGFVCWSQNGSATETPFISFLLLDDDGFIIRERRYPTLDNWPGADRLAARLGLRGK